MAIPKHFTLASNSGDNSDSTTNSKIFFLKFGSRIYDLGPVLSFPAPMAFSLPVQTPVDNDLVQAASTALQAHEKLCYELKTKLKDQPSAKDTVTQCVSVLDHLREVKSQIEGTYFKYRPLTLDNDRLTALKYQVTSHTPSTLHESHKAKMADSISELFKDQVKRMLYACVLTCSWFAGAQSEVSSQARNSILYVVYVGSDEQFFSLTTPHEKELAGTIDQGVVFAADVRHFCSHLLRGNVRAVEALCVPPECVVMATPTWYSLVSQLNPAHLLGRTFVDRCLGQAVGALVKKKKVKGQLVLRDDITPTKFCDSFRLLSYVECAGEKSPISAWTSDVTSKCSSPEAKEALQLLTRAFDGVFDRDGLLKCVLSWKERIENIEPVSPGDLWTPDLGAWLSAVRLDGVTLSPPLDPSESDQTRLASLLKDIGMSAVPPCDVLAVCEAGSRLYNLAMPTSDTDYIVIYRHSTQQIISTCKSPKESHDNRGLKLDTEAGAYEARMFCDMLLKGAVNIVEMLFAGDALYYSSEHWKALTSHREKFMSEEVVLQYLGYVKTHMKLIQSNKHSGKPRERKIFYSIFHKLLSLEAFVEGKPPVIWCSGDEREFIMTIRRGPLEGPLAPEQLYSLAVARLEELRRKLRGRNSRIREFGDYNILQSWLLSVRGVELQTELKMGSRPLTSTSTTN